nr:MAG: putative nucleocapsid protein [Trichoderma harzianum mononegavirus 2]
MAALPDEIAGLTRIINVAPDENVQPLAGVAAITVKRPIYTLSEATEMDRVKVLTAMTAFGRSTSANLTQWKSWILSYYSIAFPGLGGKMVAMNPVEYELLELPATTLRNWLQAFVTIDSSAEADPTVDLEALIHFPDEDIQPMDNDLAASIDLNGVYGYAALLLFLCGKTINARNRSAIASTRPKRLMESVDMPNAVYYMTGTGRISDVGHEAITKAWGQAEGPREVAIDHLARMHAQPTQTTPYRIMSNMLGLMKFSGYGYVKLIDRLITNCPWVTEMASIRGDYLAYRESTLRLANVTGYMIPYYKLARGSRCELFRRRSMNALIAIAAHFAAQTEDTMKNFVIGAGHAAIIEEFTRVAAAHGLELRAVVMTTDDNVNTAAVI